MNELNPLVLALNDIDTRYIIEPKRRKRPRGIKAIMIAAAAAVLCAATTITAVASLKAPVNITIDGIPVESIYSVTNDGYGNEWDVYVIDMPDYTFGEEKEGYTAVGEVKVVWNPEFPDRYFEWLIVDEVGNVFPWGINNKAIYLFRKGDPYPTHFDSANYRGDIYTYFEYNEYPNIRVELVPIEEVDDYLKEHQLPPYVPPLPSNS